MKRNHLFIIIISLVLFLMACGGNKLNVDVSKIDVKLEINRLDKDLMANYPDTLDVYKLIDKYGSFLDLYSKYVINAGDPAQKNFASAIIDFNKYCNDYQIPTKVDQVFGNFSGIETELVHAFKHYKYYFPKKNTPKIYTYLANFGLSVVVDEGLLGIGLDKYLGADFGMYPKLGFDNYMILKMHKGMIIVDCMRAMAESEFPYNDSVDNMINKMVYEGKIQYFIDAMLPAVPDTLKLGYTKDQFEWADYNEHKMWAYMVENKLLFSTDELTIRKMNGDGPFTTLFANNSAPRAGAFLGWKIVKRYMDKNPDVTFQQLMNNRDYQGVLNAAAYKP